MVRWDSNPPPGQGCLPILRLSDFPYAAFTSYHIQTHYNSQFNGTELTWHEKRYTVFEYGDPLWAGFEPARGFYFHRPLIGPMSNRLHHHPGSSESWLPITVRVNYSHTIFKHTAELNRLTRYLALWPGPKLWVTTLWHLRICLEIRLTDQRVCLNMVSRHINNTSKDPVSSWHDTWNLANCVKNLLISQLM